MEVVLEYDYVILLKSIIQEYMAMSSWILSIILQNVLISRKLD